MARAKRIKPMHTRAELLEFAIGLEQHYTGQGFSLTLRQMYYQLVARGHLENGQKHYKRIGDVLTKARYDGGFPLQGLVDRGRSIKDGSSTRCDDSIQTGAGDATNWIRNLPEFLIQTDRWYGQDTYVSVWVEKEALAEIFEQTCNQLGVGWFACRGYPSVSSLYSFLKTAERATDGGERHPRYSFGASSWEERHQGTAEKVVVLYFGDHDPDGWEIPRSCERNLSILQDRVGTEMEIEFKRIALNMDQIEEFDPPPFPAKTTSSRYDSYYEEHNTDDAWELDALEPPVLQKLITENVEAYFDEEIFNEQQGEMGARQDTLRDQMSEPEFYDGIF